jgi:hypothetical protein
MRIENLSGHPAGEACAAFVENSRISNYKDYDYVEESEEPLNEDEIDNGLDGFYTIVIVKHCISEEMFRGYVRCCEGYDTVCTTVETVK